MPKLPRNLAPLLEECAIHNVPKSKTQFGLEKHIFCYKLLYEHLYIAYINGLLYVKVNVRQTLLNSLLIYMLFFICKTKMECVMIVYMIFNILYGFHMG